MLYQEIANELMSLFKSNGIIIFEDKTDLPLEIDSLLFVSMIIQVEDRFHITIPDFYMSGSNLSTFRHYCELVQLLLSNKWANRYYAKNGGAFDEKVGKA